MISGFEIDIIKTEMILLVKDLLTGGKGMNYVMILTGAGQISMAIARRMGYGMKIIVGDKKLRMPGAFLRS